MIINQLRTKYWIPGIRRVVKSVVNRCVPCKRWRSKPQEQQMSDLPPPRVQPYKNPFRSSGCDVFGPMYVKIGRVKRYCCIYTCLASRAIHLEVLHSLDTSSFINGFRRFTARRGLIDRLVLDNATNNKSGDREMSQEITKWNKSEIGRQLLRHSTTFMFNTPTASHQGGVFERVIRSCREHLRHVTGFQSLTEENLQTLVVEVELLVNSRPLTEVSSDPFDLAAITPNDLLILKPMDPLPPGVFEPDPTRLRRGWKQVQSLANAFWRRWISDYLPTLSKRAKWAQPRRNLRVGDLCLLQDDTVTRGHWPLARITATFPSKDGLVRNVEVKTKTGLYRRPIQKLYLIESAPLQ